MGLRVGKFRHCLDLAKSVFSINYFIAFFSLLPRNIFLFGLVIDVYYFDIVSFAVEVFFMGPSLTSGVAV